MATTSHPAGGEQLGDRGGRGALADRHSAGDPDDERRAPSRPGRRPAGRAARIPLGPPPGGAYAGARATGVCRTPRGRSPFRGPNAREWCDVGPGHPFFCALGRAGRPGRADAAPSAGTGESTRHLVRMRYMPGPRRPARVRGHRGAALPRRPELDPRRVPRRRRLLRDQRLPHHVAAARRVPEPRAASGSASSTCAAPADCCPRCSCCSASSASSPSSSCPTR